MYRYWLLKYHRLTHSDSSIISINSRFTVLKHTACSCCTVVLFCRENVAISSFWFHAFVNVDLSVFICHWSFLSLQSPKGGRAFEWDVLHSFISFLSSSVRSQRIPLAIWWSASAFSSWRPRCWHRSVLGSAVDLWQEQPGVPQRLLGSLGHCWDRA